MPPAGLLAASGPHCSGAGAGPFFQAEPHSQQKFQLCTSPLHGPYHAHGSKNKKIGAGGLPDVVEITSWVTRERHVLLCYFLFPPSLPNLVARGFFKRVTRDALS